MNSDIQIVQLTSGTKESLAEDFIELNYKLKQYLDNMDKDVYNPHNKLSMEDVEYHMEHDIVFILIKNQKSIGCIILSEYPDLKNGMFVTSLYVEPDQRGLGYGKKLIEMVTRVVRERNQEHVVLYASNNNTHAIDIYEKMGFVTRNRTMVLTIPRRNDMEEQVKETIKDIPAELKHFILTHSEQFIGETLEETKENIRSFVDLTMNKFMIDCLYITNGYKQI